MKLNAVWCDGQLHVWGMAPPLCDQVDVADKAIRVGDDDLHLVDGVVLRQVVGDFLDSLLVSGAVASDLVLRLPKSTGSQQAHDLADTEGSGAVAVASTNLVATSVPTLAFGPADAIDLLTSLPATDHEQVHCSPSLRYWSKLALLVLELLARQRFVPSVHDADGRRYIGYWRVMIRDESTLDRLRALMTSMPPVCRSLAGQVEPDAASLIENFLWHGVDALVRRCLEGDELTQSLHDRAGEGKLQTCWLRSLVSTDPVLEGSPEDCRSVFETVRAWVEKLEPRDHGRSVKTVLRLHSPSEVGPEDGDADASSSWHISVLARSTEGAGWTVDAKRLWEDGGDAPEILRRPLGSARDELLEDLHHAGRHFAPLQAIGAPPEPCALSLSEAYQFLRDVAPVLALEGFDVELPTWWDEDRPRLQLQLDVNPISPPPMAPQGSIGLDALVDYKWRVAIGDEDLTEEEINSLTDSKQPLVKLRGRWTEVQSADVQAARRFLSSQGTGRMTVLSALRQCYLSDTQEMGLPVAGMRAEGWIAQLLNGVDAKVELEEIDAPADFHGTLRPYQLNGLRWLWFLTRCGLGACLADDMGLGKTIQLISLWLHERRDGKSPGQTLLIVPMSLVGNWQREIQRFAPTLRVMVHHGLERLSGNAFIEEVDKHDIVISTYGLTHRDFDHLAAVDWYRVALDEAQNVKNPAAKQSVSIRSLRAVHRLALTGTPVENHLSELWSIMEFLNPSYLGGPRDFRRRFAVPIERHHDAERADRLRRLVRPFLLRRKKSDPLIEVDLPPKMEMKVYCNLTREQAALYEALLEEMLSQIDNAGGIQRRGLILATLVKLKQVCNHPAQFLRDDSPLPHRSGKCDRITEMMEEVLAEGGRALVFTQFRQMGTLLHKLLVDTFGIDPLFLHGGTKKNDRDRMVERFQAKESPVFILSLKAGGFGLNLTAANHVFHFDRWWNPAVEDQATDRAHRIGQERRLQVHKFVCVGTLEERVDELIERKRSLADHIVTPGEEWITQMSTEALRDLFTLSKDAVAED